MTPIINKPEDIHHLLVFDDNFAKYKDYFNSTNWDIHIFELGPLGNIILPDDLEKKYSAILLDFTWLERIEISEAVFLDKIKSANIPWIIFTLGSWANYEKAMLLGASGFISKEELVQECLPQEILSILQQDVLNSSAGRALPRSLHHVQEVLAYFLRQRTICTPNWTDFFGKTAEEAFEEEVLHILSDCALRNLGGFIRYAIFSAHSDKAEKINKTHLGQRFQMEYDSQKVRELEKDLLYLKEFRDSLGDISMAELARERNISITELKEELRTIRIRYPNLLTRKAFPLIFEKFPINIMLVYNNASEMAGEFKKYLPPLEHSFTLERLDHNNLEPGDRIDKEIRKHIEKAELFILLLCPDFLTDKEGCIEIAKEAFQRQKQEKVRIIPVLLQYCLWEEIPYIEPLQILPRNKRAVKEGPNVHEVLVTVFNEIKPFLDETWET